MRKLLGFLFVFCTTFFIFSINSSAWAGPYVYGINKIGFESNKFIVDGWGVISNYNNKEMDNNNPIFKLKVKICKDDKCSSSKIIKSYSLDNEYYNSHSRITDKTKNPIYWSYFAQETAYSYLNNYFSFSLSGIEIEKTINELSYDIHLVPIPGEEGWYWKIYPPIYLKLDLEISVNGVTKTIEDLNFLKNAVISGSIFNFVNYKIGKDLDVTLSYANTKTVRTVVQGGIFRTVNYFTNYKLSENRLRINNKNIAVITGEDYQVKNINPNQSYYMYEVLIDKNNIYQYNAVASASSVAKYTCAEDPYRIVSGIPGYKGCWGINSNGVNSAWAPPGNDPSVTEFIPAFWTVLPSSSVPIKIEKECISTCPVPDVVETSGTEVNENPDGSVISSDNPDKKETYYYTCDVSEEAETKTSDLPHLQKETIFDNGYCSVKCEEDVSIQYDGKKYVTAGMWFKYPIKIDGNRVCEFDFYKYKELLDDLDKFQGITKIDNPCLDNCFNNWIDIYKTLTTAFNQCLIVKDNFSTGPNKYNFDADVRGEFEMSGGIEKNVSYTKVRDGKLNNSFSNESYVCVNRQDYSDYYSCQAGTEGNRILVPITWNLNSTLKDVVYDMASVYYSEQSTGRIVTENQMSPTEKYYLAGEDGRVFFTDMRDALCTYPFTIYVDEIARNIGTYWERRKYVEITCEYTVEKGLISYPQENGFCPNPNDDPSDGNKSGINVQYRQISLNKVFPTTSKITNNYYGYNWLSEEGLKVAADIEKKGYSLYNQRPIYTFSAGVFQNVAVKLYNLTHKYGEFNLNEYEQSKFINANLDKYKRGK